MEKFLPWVALKNVPGIGNLLFKRLFQHFQSPEAVFRAAPEELLRVQGMTRRLADAVARYRIPDRVRQDLDRALAQKYRLLTMADPAYPPLLLEIPDPPPLLYVCGRLPATPLNIAVVGSRNATAYGISTTTRLCSDLASMGVTIVSGMARGIDTAAHTGCLMGRGNTIAVLGSGLDRIYPAQNKKLFYQIAEQGAVISEFPLATEPEAHNFPLRNRIISGICHGTVIVEATLRSGSLITARLAAEQNRDVFAVPGSIRSFKSTGTHTLIKQGAKLVENAQDITEEFGHLVNPPETRRPSDPSPAGPNALPRGLTPDEADVYKRLSAYPVHIDDLVRQTAIAPGRLSSILLQLELKGAVSQLPGKLFAVADPGA